MRAVLPPEKAYSVLKTQLARLQDLKGRNYQEAKAAENEWFQLTESFVLRSFGSESTNYINFRSALSAGQHYGEWKDDDVPKAHYQRTFEARQLAYEAALRSSIAELEVDLPDTEIKGVYQPGEEYEFYRDVTACLKLAQKRFSSSILI